MTKEWLKVVFASLFELVWVSGLAHASTVLEWVLTAIGVVVSFYLLTSSVKKLPIGTVYAVFAGLGSIGSIIVGVTFFGESISLLKIVFMGTLLLGIIGLKLIETDKDEVK
ncbi:SMR family transporter [Vagococcus sp. PNs007]|uniref:SMR family transporter n=1 Tax=Vagococcus proximus TaxID=2991417 RepID=A0ABT5WYM2_9ENTE|nr:SMR family transporter [Vagococcus proximus]MDF0478850.1 SMR family transporter [Vagococcus proximus]